MFACYGFCNLVAAESSLALTMASRVWLNLIMLATAVSLAVFLYIKPSLQPQTTYPISLLSKEGVQLIQISSKHGVIELKQSNGDWLMTKPFQARADKTKVERILDLLAITSDYRLPLENLSRYGLATPVVQLQLNHELFAFGQLAPVSNHQYVMTQSGIFLISPHHAMLLTVAPTELIDRQLLSEAEIPQEFIFKTMHLKQAEKWLLFSEVSDIEPSQDDINQWVHSWRLAQASYVTLNEHGIDDTREAITIVLQSGEPIHFLILQKDPELVLFRQSQLINYHFLGRSGNQLLSPHFMVKHEEKMVE